MNQVFLWESGASAGPFDVASVWERIRENRLAPGTLFSFDQADWKPLHQLPAEPTVAKRLNPPVVVHFARGSEWSTFLRIAGTVCVVGGLILAYTRESMSWVFIGVGGGVTSYFWAFLVDVFTDIRWLLNDIRQSKDR